MFSAMKKVEAVLSALALLALASGGPGWGYSNSSDAVDGAGQWQSGGTFSNISAVGQSGGVSVSANGAMRNLAGFLNTFILKPALDTDRDGLADELDPDNDNDGLEDAVELAGSAFFPATTTDLNLADTDHDGATDAQEAAAGTDPLDASAYLRILSVRRVSTGVEVGWIGRSFYRYSMRGERDLSRAPSFTNELANLQLLDAAPPPWCVVTNYFTDTGAFATNRGFYRVQLAP